jgi:hypothetical protein
VRQAQPTGISNLSGVSRGSENAGAPEEIRTPDPQIRSLVLALPVATLCKLRD